MGPVPSRAPIGESGRRASRSKARHMGRLALTAARSRRGSTRWYGRAIPGASGAGVPSAPTDALGGSSPATVGWTPPRLVGPWAAVAPMTIGWGAARVVEPTRSSIRVFARLPGDFHPGVIDDEPDAERVEVRPPDSVRRPIPGQQHACPQSTSLDLQPDPPRRDAANLAGGRLGGQPGVARRLDGTPWKWDHGSPASSRATTRRLST